MNCLRSPPQIFILILLSIPVGSSIGHSKRDSFPNKTWTTPRIKASKIVFPKRNFLSRPRKRTESSGFVGLYLDFFLAPRKSQPSIRIVNICHIKKVGIETTLLSDTSLMLGLEHLVLQFTTCTQLPQSQPILEVNHFLFSLFDIVDNVCQETNSLVFSLTSPTTRTDSSLSTAYDRSFSEEWNCGVEHTWHRIRAELRCSFP